ncbi:MAG: hypothetical protein PVI20_08940 [Desulfobacteraceae bacterium]|jgi:hypothetical protein
MGEAKTFTNNLLILELRENNNSINIRWTGKSVDREPAKFITPILVDAIRKSSDHDKRVKLDFRELTYMNSSTITPIVKTLERAKRGKTKVTVTYLKSLKWQDVIFSALEIFRTKDGRVEIKGS